MRVCVSVLLLLATFPLSAEELRWGKAYRDSYFSKADGKRIGFSVRMPPRVDRLKKYPLVVGLKGSLRVNPSGEFPFIEVRPSRGNVWGYRAISAFDVTQVIAHMKREYPVDPDRVYLIGFSAGASGAMHLASQYPDQFAAVLPLVAAGNNYPIANFLNLPVAFHHGARDWTSAICDARAQYQRMNRFGCPTRLIEYETAGHSIPRPHEPLMKWLLEQRRNTWPMRVTHVCDTPELGKSYWLKIEEFDDPHRPASIEAVISDGVLTVNSANVSAVSFDDLPAGHVRIEEQTFVIRGSRSFMRTKSGWKVGLPDPMIGRPYRAGAAANLFQGEPLMVVYGTGSGDEKRVQLLRQAAQKVSACGGAHHGELRSRFPVIADTELTAEVARMCNLVLIGTSDDIPTFARAMPLKISEGKLIVGGRPALALTNRVVSVLHRNPDHPNRLLYRLLPFTDEVGAARFADHARRYLVGSDGFDRGSQGDLVVMDLGQRICRQMQFGRDWKWRPLMAEEQRLPDSFADRSDFAMTHLKVMRAKSKADFAIWWGPKDKGMWGADFNFLKRYHPEACTRTDLAIECRLVETMLGSVTGEELKEIVKRWLEKDELISFPEIKEVKDQRIYRLHLPMDLYIKLGQRRKNLRDPKPGPLIRTKDVVSELFR